MIEVRGSSRNGKTLERVEKGVNVQPKGNDRGHRPDLENLPDAETPGKLTELQILTLREHRKLGLSYAEIAKIMGVSKTTVHNYARDVVIASQASAKGPGKDSQRPSEVYALPSYHIAPSGANLPQLQFDWPGELVLDMVA